MAPRISIVIPTYNRADKLATAISSALTAVTEPEIIVVDDASADNTRDVCLGFPGVRYIRHDENRGLASARNLGILNSSCPYLVFLDDDDELLEGTLETQLCLLEQAPTMGFVYGRYLRGHPDSCEPQGSPLPLDQPAGDVFEKLLAGNFMPVHTLLLRRDVLATTGLFTGEFWALEDWHLWLRVTAAFPVLANPQTVAVYRLPTTQSGQMSSHPVRMARSALRLQATVLRSPRGRQLGVAARLRARLLLRNRLSDSLILQGEDALAEGSPRAAVGRVLYGILLHPLRGLRIRWVSLLVKAVDRKSVV